MRIKYFSCVCLCAWFKFVAQARLSELHDEIEKAEQQILRATEEFKQLEEAVQLKKVGERKAVLLRGHARVSVLPSSQLCKDRLQTVFTSVLLFNCGITNFRVRRGLAFSNFISYHSG